MICTIGDPITWPPILALAVKIDSLAVTLNTPGYSPLVDEPPFMFPDKVPTGVFYQVFDVSSGGAVTVRWMGSAIHGGSAYSFPLPGLTDLADLGELFFISDNDDCLCPSLYQVIAEAGGYTLATTPSVGCCPSVEVPEVSSSLPLSGEHGIVPMRPTTRYLDDGAPGGGTVDVSMEIAKDACVAGGEVGYKFEAPNTVEEAEFGGSDLTRISRRMSGYFTWGIKKRYMNLMWAALEFILDCDRNDGLKPEDIGPTPSSVVGGVTDSNPTTYRYDSTYAAVSPFETDGWFLRGSSCAPQTLETWLASLRFEFETFANNEHDPAEPGTLTDVFSSPPGASNESVSQCVGRMKRPWDELAGGAANCDTSGLPTVYCETFNRIEDLIDTMEARLWPEGIFTTVTPFDTGDCPQDPEEVVSCCIEAGGEEDPKCSLMSRLECGAAGGSVISDCEMCSSCDDAKRTECEATEILDCFGNSGGFCTWDAAECLCECPEYTNEDCWDAVNDEGVCCCYDPETMTTNCTTYYPGVDCELVAGEGCYPEQGPNPYTPAPYETLSAEPDCEDCDSQCCLLHPAFNRAPYGCVEYFDEIVDWVQRATGGTFLSLQCSYPEKDTVDPDFDCSSIKCGPVLCTDVIPEEMEVCLNQAALMWNLVSTGSDPAWYYLEITPLAPPP